MDGVRQAGSRKVTRRPITLPIPSDSFQVDSDTALVPGIKLNACYGGRWCVVTVTEVHDDGAVQVNWDDWKSYTYDMTRDDLIISKLSLGDTDR